MKPSTTPMARGTPMKARRKVRPKIDGIDHSNFKIPKSMTYRNSKLLSLAKGQSCVECGTDDGTIVSAHSNEGKGMGLKASDATIMFLCYACHSGYDQGKIMSKDERREFAFRNNAKTLRRLLEKGLIDVTR